MTDLLDSPTSASDMVSLFFGMQSYFKSSTYLEKESGTSMDTIPPQTLDSCKFCWNESSGSKFKVVYEVRRMFELANKNIFES